MTRFVESRMPRLEKENERKINDLEEDNDELKEKYVDDFNKGLILLKKYIIQEHINDFNKGLIL